MYGPQLQSGQEYAIRFGNGNYFTAEPNGTYRYNANAIGDWEKFRLNNEGNNRWSLRTAHGKVVCYDQGKNSFDVRDAVGDWEKFEFHPSGNGGFHMHCPAQRVFFNFDQGHARHVPDQHHSSIVWLTPANQAQQQGYPQGYPPQQQGYPQQQQQYGNMNINVSTNLQSGQEYTIRLPHGRYLTAEPNGTYRMDADRVGDWEKFRFNAENNGQFSLRTAHGKVVCYDQGKSKFETRDAAGDWEKFEFRPSGNGAFHMYCPAQRIFIQFEHNGNTRAVQDHHHASQLHIAPANQSGQGQPQYNQYNQQPQYNQYGGQPQYNQQPQYGQPPSPFANGNLTTGCYFIRNYHGKFLSIDRSRVHQEQAPGADERLMIQEVGPSQFGIRSAANGRVICFDDSGRIELRDNIGAWETVEIRPVPNRFGFFSIYNASQRKYLSCNHHGGVTASHQLGDSEVYQFLPTA